MAQWTTAENPTARIYIPYRVIFRRKQYARMFAFAQKRASPPKADITGRE